MTMTDTDKQIPDGEFSLDSFFEAAIVAPPHPTDALMSRVLADGLAAQPLSEGIAGGYLHKQVRLSLWARMCAGAGSALGGATGLAGLVTAALAGVWIGLANPAPLSAFEALVLGESDTLDLGAELSDLLPSVDELLPEG
jgi:hypothetical protein